MTRLSLYFFLIIVVTFSSQAVSADLSVDSIAIPTGHVVTDGKNVLVNGDNIYSDYAIRMFDFGPAGILVEANHGGQHCPFSFQLIEPQTGEFRNLREGAERPTIFAECHRLDTVSKELGIILMKPASTIEQARIYAWNGHQFTKTILERSQDGAPKFEGGEQVRKWIGGDPFEFLKDPTEVVRLKSVLKDAQLQQVRSSILRAGRIHEQTGFIIVEGCDGDLCAAVWASIAIRISDGAPFVVGNDGLVAGPEGERLPDYLQNIAENGQLH